MRNRLGHTKFDFTGRIKVWMCISLGIILVGLIINVFFGVKLDINFKGGTILTYNYSGDIDESEAESVIGDALGQSVQVTFSTQLASSQKGMTVTLVESDEVSTATQETITAALTEKYPDSGIEFTSSNSVSPTVGRSFFLKSLYAILLAGIFVIIYVAIRFRKIGGFPAGIMAFVALFHDMLVIYFVFVIFRLPLDDNFIAVILTILGYSLNDTIIIYDRIREDRAKEKKMPFGDLVNQSINRTLGRTVNTSVATFLAAITVLVVALVAGLTSIISFALPMAIGVISGSYSSICVAGPLWVLWENHKEKRDAGKKTPKKGSKKARA